MIPSWCDADVACSDFLNEHVGYSGTSICISRESLWKTNVMVNNSIYLRQTKHLDSAQVSRLAASVHDIGRMCFVLQFRLVGFEILHGGLRYGKVCVHTM